MAAGESGRALVVAAALALAVSGSGCAHRMGEQSAKGVASAIEDQTDPNKQLMRVGATRAVEGAVAALDSPEQREQIRTLVSEIMRVGATHAVEGAVAALDAPEQREQIRSVVSEVMSEAIQTAIEDASRQMVAQLGPDGEGPLAASLTSASSRISAGVVSGARGELMAMFPDCAGSDPRACVQRQLQEMARFTAVGFTKGVRDTLGVPMLIFAFVLGAAGGVLGALAWARRPQRRVLRTA